MMQTDWIHSQGNDESQPQSPRPVLTAILVGLGLGILFAIAWPGAPGLVALARWSAGLATGLLSFALTGRRYPVSTRWGLVLAGQGFALLAAALFFFASLIY
jgi:hypothetical protein